jgi:hypothetical protein
MSQREQADAFIKQMEEFSETMKRSVGVPAIIDPRSVRVKALRRGRPPPPPLWGRAGQGDLMFHSPSLYIP